MNITKYQSKIKIVDDTETRKILVDKIETQHKKNASKWAINLALRIFDVVGIDSKSNDLIQRAIDHNSRYNDKLLSINELREIGFEIHQYARNQEDPLKQFAYRAFGHAVSTAHMKEHAIVSSDYVIKVLNIMRHNRYDIVLKERKLQLEELNRLIE
jgi:hypothetical protein